MNIMTYKGYTARIEFDERDNLFVGRVLGVKAIIGFHGETVAELRTDFEAAIDFMIEDCRIRGETPARPYSGKLMLRLPPDVHAHAAMMAEVHGKSLNQWAAEVLESAR
ncbi:type II toxin-antitoxin system HicB family antitoxin [Candidatus Thiodictyon syntrophicum]|jgi:predicted HicB family RNase H-like nuclease|uniref:Antitoxin HicB n=1 Tax=Candidatus Thiodictyon syntrophicum TaxID=1166950 RepID=A0A2K8U962_9GAMM|nr:type II toxin-antitoxin system HicB family antitoxin [Candidatus Thiodictyon syntrophicum]AUB82095.1 antitoxin HicB [Candidatus Thiodictyon syntrophicum]